MTYDDWKATEDMDPVSDALEWHAREMEAAESAGYGDGMIAGYDSGVEATMIDLLGLLARECRTGASETRERLKMIARYMYAIHPLSLRSATDGDNAARISDMLWGDK